MDRKLNLLRLTISLIVAFIVTNLSLCHQVSFEAFRFPWVFILIANYLKVIMNKEQKYKTSTGYLLNLLVQFTLVYLDLGGKNMIKILLMIFLDSNIWTILKQLQIEQNFQVIQQASVDEIKRSPSDMFFLVFPLSYCNGNIMLVMFKYKYLLIINSIKVDTCQGSLRNHHCLCFLQNINVISFTPKSKSF